MHANTTIPEVLGAARAWEVTGDARWRAIVEAYWHYAVTAAATSPPVDRPAAKSGRRPIQQAPAWATKTRSTARSTI